MNIKIKNAILSYIPPFDLTPYVVSMTPTSVNTDEYTKVLTDNSGRILYAENADGVVVDVTDSLGTTVVGDTTLAKIISTFAK